MSGKRIFGYRSNVRATAQRERALSGRDATTTGALLISVPLVVIGALLLFFSALFVVAKFLFDLLVTLAIVVRHPRTAGSVIAGGVRGPLARARRVALLLLQISSAVALVFVMIVAVLLVVEIPWFGAGWLGLGLASVALRFRRHPSRGWYRIVFTLMSIVLTGPAAGLLVWAWDMVSRRLRRRRPEKVAPPVVVASAG